MTTLPKSIAPASCGNGCEGTRVTSPGTPRRAWRREDHRARFRDAIRSNGGFTFAEDPQHAAPDARIIWRASLDPATLAAIAVPSIASDPDAIDPERLVPWLSSVTDADGEHVVLSDGRHRLRIDLIEGSLSARRPVVLHYRLSGIASPRWPLVTLGKLIGLVKYARFASDRHPSDLRIARDVLTLRVHDALATGASQSEIAEGLFGKSHPDSADSVRSRTRRLIREARRMARGGWRAMMRIR